ncbi:MAG: hypothetical protein Q9217_005416 [Psora testacea]
MPGRQSTGPPSLHKPKPKKQKAKRSLNALAIAEKEIPSRIKIRRNRLGESEPQTSNHKRRRQDEDHGFPNEKPAKRLKRKPKGTNGDDDVEVASDSSSNEWTTGEVAEEDDSELDSDEAMGESGEERFEGYAFSGSSSRKPGPKAGEKRAARMGKDGEMGGIDLAEEEDENEIDREDDTFRGDGVDLATMLDDESGETTASRTLSSSKTREQEMRRSGSEADGTDEESVFDKEDSVLSVSENEDDTVDASKLATLQALIATMDNHDEASTQPRAPDAQESMTPSEFGLNSKRKLTVADLMSSVTDPQLKKSLKLLAEDDSVSRTKRGGIPKKLDVPLPKRQQDRIDRAAAYKKSKETLSRWIDTIKHNRRAEHLSFPLQNPNAVARQGDRRMLPNTESKPLTDLESTIKNILQDSGLAPQNGKSEEDQIQAFEELETNKMPIEEVLARRAELRRSRELLFREEIRAKRIKKIKSKKYRKIHRKQRERNALQLQAAMAANGEDDYESEKERNDRRRAEERMGARHRESRWAKNVKNSGRAKWDDDARDGINEMARRGEDLRRRMEGKEIREEGDSGLSPSEEDEDMDGNADDQHQRLQQRLEGLRDEGVIQDGRKGNRLSNMDFMKKAEATRKARNDAEAESLRRHLAGEETPSEEEGAEGPGRKSYGPQKKERERQHSMPAVDKSEFEEREDSDVEDEMVRQKGDVDIDSVFVDAGHGDLANNVSSENFAPRATVTEGPWNATSSKQAIASCEQLQSHGALKTADNGNKATQGSALKGVQAVEEALPSRPTQKETAAEDPDSEEEDDITAPHRPILSRNGELAKRAFAGDDVVDKFLEEKEELIREQQPQVIDNTLPGWGTWTGLGLSKKSQKRNTKKFVTKVPGIAPESRKDAKLKDVIISEKRVKKNAKYLAGQLPHPFETRAQYERSLRLPVGPEWTTKETFQGMTKPRILMKQGIIAPMAKPIV